jgi:hypothetical protein
MSVLARMLMTLLTMTVGAAQAFAEQQVTVTTDHCRPQMGVTIGAAANGDRNAGRSTYPDNPSTGAVDTAASFELPVSDLVGARLDVGTAAWAFQSRDAWGAPLVRDRVRVGRATLSIVKVARCGSPVQGHAGLGLGAYRYQFDAGAVDRIRAGAHGFIGFDVTMSERVAMTTDFAVHVIGGPDQPPVFSYWLWVVRASVGVRFRF